MADISLAELDQAEARLAEAKGRYFGRKGARNEEHRDAHKQAMQELADLRSKYRQQEEAAGRRTGLVGGDAVQTGG